jgi:Uma2 family endonuclease
MAMPVTVRRYTVDEVESWPDDGNRYELLDGILLVTQSPVVPHQSVATRLAVMLTNALDPFRGIRVVAPGAIVRPPFIDL